MNKDFYRVIFNKARGILMVVSELTSSGSKASTKKQTKQVCARSVLAKLKPISFLTYVLLGYVSISLPVQSNGIVIDSNAHKNQQPVVIPSANGTPQVNIQTPSKGGVSHNKFTQFDINEKGVILNNSHKSSMTELGGYVKGNDFLTTTGGASIILNEVNSRNPSRLNGYIEVAGQRAQVVIANSAGITCNGCGFINANRATLTTGTPVMENGHLKGYLVEQGNIAINGKGLDSSRQNYTDLIARTVSLNANLHARDLSVVTGRNQVNHGLSQIDKLADDGNAKPQLSIDVAALGGMYAGKIRMVGTETGVGVRNAGAIGASAGSVVITADGRIENSRQIYGQQDIALNNTQDIVNTGTIGTKTGNINLNTQGKLNNTGQIASQENLNITTKDSLTNSGTLGSIAGNTTVDSTKQIENAHRILGEQGLSVTSTEGIKNTGVLGSNQGNISLMTNHSIVNEGTVLSDSALSVTAKQALINRGNIKSNNDQINIHADALVHNTGVIVSEQDLSITSQQAILNQGDMGSLNGQVSLAANIINNEATLIAQQKMQLDTTGTVVNSGTMVSKDDGVIVNAEGDISHSGTMIAQSLSLSTQAMLTNNEGKLSGQNISIQANDFSQNQQGEINATNQLSMNINQHLQNWGLLNGEQVTIKAHTLDNMGTGRIYGTQLAIGAHTLNNTAQDGVAATIVAREQLLIGAHTINNRDHAMIYSDGNLFIGGALSDSEGVTGSSEALNNHSSTIEAANNIRLAVNQLNNINDRFETAVQEVSRENIIEYQMRGSPDRYSPDEVYFEYNEVSYMCVKATGQCNDYYYKYQYESVVNETVITASDPAKIIAGNHLQINADQVLNDKSQLVAGGTLSVWANAVNNVDVTGERHINDAGQAIYFYRIHKKGSDKQGTSYSNYRPAEQIQVITLKPSTMEEHVTVNSSNVNVGQLHNSGSTVTLNNPSVTLPTQNSIFNVNPNADSHYLIETDPRFTNRKNWLGSDYMLNLLKQDPNNIQKRLGDGYYEQRLIREQIIELTGQRYLNGYGNDEEQYKALMQSGVEFAEEYQLKPGIALTAEQMSALTHDIVWLVSKSITLPDGSTQHVLVPQVYAVVKKGDLNGSGALLSGRDVALEMTDDFNNQGRVIAGDRININANDINNQLGGHILGNNIQLTAGQDINNMGGSIAAGDSLLLNAGRDVNIVSTTRSNENAVDNNRFSHTQIDSVGSLSVNNDNGQLVVKAGNDINLQAAQIITAGKDSTIVLDAVNDVNITTVETQSNQSVSFDKNNYTKQNITTEVGSTIIGNGDVIIKAGNDVIVKGGDISAEKGLSLTAGHDLTIEEVRQHIEYEDHTKVKGQSGGGTKQTITMHTELNNDLATGSQLNGNEISLTSGNDILIQGSQVIGTQDVTLNSGNNLTLTTAEERFDETNESTKTKSGFMSSGGLGVTYGKFKEKTDQHEVETAYLASTLGSTEGNVNMTAGRDVTIKGSEVIAKGDMGVQGENILLESLDATTRYQEKYEMEKTGVTIAVTGTAADAYDLIQTVRHARENNNSQLEALQNIKSALTAVEILQDLQMAADKNPNGSASIGLSIMGGTQRTERENNQEQHTVKGSGLSAGNNITLTATGNGAKEGGNITLKGSEVKAGNDINIKALGDLNVIGAVNTQHSDRDEKSYGGSIGIGFAIGGDESGIRFKGNANFSRERENADGSAWTESIIDAGNKLTIKTGNNVNIIGGQLKGDTVVADIGNNLNIQSLQDTDNYDYKKISGSVDVSGGVGGFSGNLSLSQTDIDSKWASVTDQSGIFAGSGGFDFRVENNTDLKGSVIASDATDKTQNKLDTGTLSFSDIENKADYNVDYQSVSVGTSAVAPPIQHNASGSDSSTTQSAVEEGELIVRNQDEQQQDINALSRDTEHANDTLGQIFDKQKELDKIEAMELAKDISQKVTNVLDNMNKMEAHEEAQKYVESLGPLTDKEKADKYTEKYNKLMSESSTALGGDMRQAIGSITSIIQGIISGDITGGLAGASAPYLAEKLKPLEDNPVAHKLAHGILGAVVAQIQGNSALSGSTGAITGEIAADIIRKNLYGDKAVSELSPKEKDEINALAVLVAGLAGAATGDGKVSDIGTAVGGSKTAVENNWMALEIMYEQEQELRDTKLLFGGDEKKAQEYINAKNKAQGIGAVDGIVGSINGLIDLVTSPIETTNNIYNAITNYDETYETIKISVTEWTELYDYALKNDPALAGEMSGYLQGMIGGGFATDMVTGYAVSGTVAKTLQKVTIQRNLRNTTKLLNELNNSGVKFTAENIIRVEKLPNGEIVFLEKGDPTSGLAHIVQKHATEFAKIGVPESKIPSVLFQTLERGVIIGEQGTRPIYEAIINGQKYKLSITVSSNGYIVGANLRGRIK